VRQVVSGDTTSRWGKSIDKGSGKGGGFPFSLSAYPEGRAGRKRGRERRSEEILHHRALSLPVYITHAPHHSHNISGATYLHNEAIRVLLCHFPVCLHRNFDSSRVGWI
jgi:hypothetical protein